MQREPGTDLQGAKGFPRGLCKVKVIVGNCEARRRGDGEGGQSCQVKRASASLPATHIEWGILRVVAELHAGPLHSHTSTGLSNEMKNFHTEVSGQESSRLKKKKKKIKTQTR